MYINNVHTTVTTAYAGRMSGPDTTESNQQPRGDNAPGNADRVTLSDSARRAAHAEGVIPGAQGDGSVTHPLEMYQLPAWRAEYMFPVSGTLGAGADRFSEQYPRAASATEAERNEYATLVDSHYQTVLEANDIRGVEAHYKATIVDQGFSESLRQQMSALVQGDARLLELMAKMGKAIS